MKALIVVDMQNDFAKPRGALSVKDGESIIPFINEKIVSKEYDWVVATQDYHPVSHKSFASNNPGKKVGEIGELAGMPQVMWPNHCVQNSWGSHFHDQIKAWNFDEVFKKGQNEDIDSYSGFMDNDKKTSTGLGEWLKRKGITEVEVVGLALDYCVKATAIDAKNLGFKTTVLLDGVKAVNLDPNDGSKAIEELKKAGVSVK